MLLLGPYSLETCVLWQLHSASEFGLSRCALSCAACLDFPACGMVTGMVTRKKNRTLACRSRRHGGTGHQRRHLVGDYHPFVHGGHLAPGPGNAEEPGRHPAGHAWTAQVSAEGGWPLWLRGRPKMMSAGTWAPPQPETDGKCPRVYSPACDMRSAVPRRLSGPAHLTYSYRRTNILSAFSNITELKALRM